MSTIPQKYQGVIKFIVGKIASIGGSAGYIATAIELILLISLDSENILDELRQDIFRIKDAHLKNGFDYLNNAIYVKNDALWWTLINNARESFTHAANVEYYSNQVRAQFYVGVCYLLLNEIESAIHCFNKSFLTGEQAMKELKGQIPSYFNRSFSDKLRFHLNDHLFTLGLPIKFEMDEEKIRRKNEKEIEEIESLDAHIAIVLADLLNLDNAKPNNIEAGSINKTILIYVVSLRNYGVPYELAFDYWYKFKDSYYLHTGRYLANWT